MKPSAHHRNTPSDGTAEDSGSRGAERIKLRVFVPLILGVAVLLGSFIVAFRQDQSRSSESAIHRSAGELQKFLQVEQKQNTDFMATAFRTFLNDSRSMRNSFS